MPSANRAAPPSRAKWSDGAASTRGIPGYATRGRSMIVAPFIFTRGKSPVSARDADGAEEGGCRMRKSHATNLPHHLIRPRSAPRFVAESPHGPTAHQRPGRTQC